MIDDHTSQKCCAHHIVAMAEFLSKQRCVDVIAYDVSMIYDYVDYSIIATTSSNVHRRGVIHGLVDFLHELHLLRYSKLLQRQAKKHEKEEWMLVDFYDFLVHLMDPNVRTFYELEKLLSKAQILYPSAQTTEISRGG